MKGKWASGIAPRNFAWIIKDRLAISERPGGYARSHRPVRRQEEIIWIREQGFARVISLLASPHNLHAYDELGVAWEHIPLRLHDDPQHVLAELYPKLAEWGAKGDKVLLHQEELGDRLLGVVTGYLLYAGRREEAKGVPLLFARYARYLADRAAGGAGVIIAGQAQVHPTSAYQMTNNAAAWTPDAVPGFRLVTDAVHQHGALAFPGPGAARVEPAQSVTMLFGEK